MQKVYISIQDFLRTGRFGAVTLGMCKTEVETILSKPNYATPLSSLLL